MSKTIVVCGHGPGISHAVAKKFAAEGFSVAIIARNTERLNAAAKELSSTGHKVAAFTADLGDPAAVKAVIKKVRAELGPITIVHWNAYGHGAGDLTTADPAELLAAFNVGVTGLVAAVQEALPDLTAQPNQAAVLVTGGGFAFYDAKVDAMAVEWNAMGIAISKAAQHKAVGILSAKLAPAHIYVGEVVVLGMVKGTAFDNGHATLDANDIAAKFHALYTARKELSVMFA